MEKQQNREWAIEGFCPFCGGENVEDHHKEWTDRTEAAQYRRCEKCGKEWREIIEVRAVILDDDEWIPLTEEKTEPVTAGRIMGDKEVEHIYIVKALSRSLLGVIENFEKDPKLSKSGFLGIVDHAVEAMRTSKEALWNLNTDKEEDE